MPLYILELPGEFSGVKNPELVELLKLGMQEKRRQIEAEKTKNRIATNEESEEEEETL